MVAQSEIAMVAAKRSREAVLKVFLEQLTLG